MALARWLPLLALAIYASLLFLYATQTGNSRGIAKDLCDKACARGHEARVLGMENFPWSLEGGKAAGGAG